MKTEALLEKLFENSTSMLLVTDEQFNIRYISSSVEASFGLQAYSVLGRNAFDFVNESNRDLWRKCLEDANGNMRSEISFITPAGQELHFDATVTNHVTNSEIRGLVVIMFDITETKKKRRLLEQTNHHLDHFIYKTIHDLKAPVHSVLGLIELTAQSDADEREKHFSLIKSNLQRMEAFIEEVSHYYKNEKLAIVRENVNLDELFQQELEALQNMPGASHITFNYKSTGNGTLYSDPLRIRTIVTNLLSNSIKYSDVRKAVRFVDIKVKVDDTECTLVIKDNGLGIPEEYLGKIFDIFFRCHTQIQGTGLGLYIVQDTLERLEGDVNVCSKVGEGTTFVITLPNLVEDPEVVA